MERLILFAKRPRLGAVKTRLVPPLRPRQALTLYRALLWDSVRLLRSLGAGRRLELCLDGPPGAALGRLAAAGSLELTRQGCGDLGERLLRAFRRSHDAGDLATVIVGADAPTLPADRIREAFRRLASGAPAVLIPAADGGYVAIGLREPVAELFSGLPWGSDRVAELTLGRAAGMALRCELLEPWYDVDDADGLRRLRAELAAAPPDRAPATARCLRRLVADVGASSRAVPWTACW